jgi:proline iminopeptidase
MSVVHTGKIDIAYEETGPVSGTAVILVRGQGTQLVHWPEEFYDSFAADGFRTIRFDNRDTGLSSKFDRIGGEKLAAMWHQATAGKAFNPPYTLEDMALDVIGLMDGLEIDKAHIVGISMGGVISQLLAARYGTRILSLTSIMSASRNIDPALLAELWLDPKSRTEVMEEWVAYMHTYGSKAYLDDDEFYRQQAGTAYDRCYAPEGANRQILAICAMKNLQDIIKTVSVPTLVVHGADDSLIPPEAGRQTAELIPGAKFKLVDGMGHDIPTALGQPLSAIIIDHMRSAEN